MRVLIACEKSQKVCNGDPKKSGTRIIFLQLKIINYE